MAKSLHERIASARATDRVTITTLAELIEEAQGEAERLTVAHGSASRDSIDFALSESDRDEAARRADSAARTLAGLANAIGELDAKLVGKRTSEGQRARKAEQEAARAERDELAARFADRVPAITAELIALFQAVEANSARMIAAGLHERNAELEARGIPGNGYWPSGGPADLFLKLKLPEFDTAARAWPVPLKPVIFDYGAEIERGREQRRAQAEAEAEAKAAHAASHGLYRVTRGNMLASYQFEYRGEKMPEFFENFVERELPHSLAEELAADGRWNVKRLDQQERAE